MKIGSLILLLGITNFLLVVFQLSTGFRFIKVRVIVHKRTGLLLLVTAIIHGALAIYSS